MVKQGFTLFIIITAVAILSACSNTNNEANVGASVEVEATLEVEASMEVEASLDVEATLEAEASVEVESDVEVVEAANETESVLAWEDQVNSIATTSGLSETEKYDQVMGIAMDYKPSESELKEFENYIISEFQNEKYLSDIKNSTYMLGNIFKSGVVEHVYDDAENRPIDSFAFDFLQNSKYTYRGADKVDSPDVIANEDQMMKSLSEIE
ncbi:hypothetical protein [Cohnella lupini]|uniref:Uncharacterized protein n=1 Tax=Cohnella lupini TaxID=1294267 RepID=A0A3D9HQ54_9BACL|nr:hypothetical protein [Cohnella lupini]RED51627.1 hypothetical protein DFP95_1422 [Cohnella lupini]